ncbi:hypothetical protein JAAARDRAFT_209274 [Jaapia argillacea MUCL 33604]|uniref:Uncharacterized protein n=1 Tax=Jaapia argillacea MUCL 33604 TaxID=933084 RepID=A0A067PI19_9AGAM|nr:hypothetical protein JAAARDRAFT_209274 [Jaapia argillacea MUCL 33604]
MEFCESPVFINPTRLFADNVPGLVTSESLDFGSPPNTPDHGDLANDYFGASSPEGGEVDQLAAEQLVEARPILILQHTHMAQQLPALPGTNIYTCHSSSLTTRSSSTRYMYAAVIEPIAVQDLVNASFASPPFPPSFPSKPTSATICAGHARSAMPNTLAMYSDRRRIVAVVGFGRWSLGNLRGLVDLASLSSSLVVSGLDCFMLDRMFEELTPSRSCCLIRDSVSSAHVSSNTLFDRSWLSF